VKMAALKLGHFKYPSGREFEIMRDLQSQDLFVDGTIIGQAEGPIEVGLLAQEEAHDR